MHVRTDPERHEDYGSHDETVGKSWMVTFSDLISLMLTFFVMLFAMSSVKVDEWDKLTDALSRTLKPEISKEEPKKSAVLNIETTFRRSGADLDYLSGVLEETLSRDELLRDALVMLLDDQLVIALPGDLLFQPSSAVPTERARQAVFTLSGVLRNIDNRIGINGHSDPSPPEGDSYTSNWELSVARAAAVADLLRQSGVDQRMTAYGFSDSRYEELPRLPESDRAAMARRVDIVVYPSVGET